MSTERQTMNRKPVLTIPAKTVVNFKSGFSHKLLCSGPTFSMGTSCAYSCAFCYVPQAMNQQIHMLKEQGKIPGDTNHFDVVMRRENALITLRNQLTDSKGKPKFKHIPDDGHVIYSSPLVDVAANMELVEETVEACKIILELTNWHIRLLSKSNLLPLIAQKLTKWDDQVEEANDYSEQLPSLIWHPRVKARMIFGVSTGTLDDKLAAAFEEGTPKVSKRIESLHWLQDEGFRTYGMICPSLPQMATYFDFAYQMAEAIRWHKCEHVWAEVINVRGESMKRTCSALFKADFTGPAALLEAVSMNPDLWERYNRDTFEAHARVYHGTGKLRYLVYETNKTRDFWRAAQERGAVICNAK